MPRTEGLRVASVPSDAPSWMASAAEAGGGQLVDVGDAEALLWAGRDPAVLASILETHRGIKWVQLAWAGVENYLDLMDDSRVWTSGKGVYGLVVAEHALMSVLALMHCIPALVRADTWKSVEPRSLFDARVAIIGGGGIAIELIKLLMPFRVSVTVVRRRPAIMTGTVTVLGLNELLNGLRSADVVVLATALTPDTVGMIGAAQLGAMKPDALLVNVARGRLVITDDLVKALRSGWISGAALDVTDPEPLPDGHPLWQLENCLITPHSASRLEMVRAQYSQLVVENVRRFSRRAPLLGTVDLQHGY